MNNDNKEPSLEQVKARVMKHQSSIMDRLTRLLKIKLPPNAEDGVMVGTVKEEKENTNET